MSRLLYNVPINSNRDYMQDQNREHYLVESISNCTLVSSRTTADTHAPALDIDIPAVVTSAPDGLTLWLDAPTRPRHFKRLLAELDHSGLLRPGFELARPLRRRARRRELFDAERTSALDVSSIWDSMLSLSNGFVGNFEDLLTTGRAVSPEPRVVTAPMMENPWPIRWKEGLDVFLAPSSTEGHSHLYIEAQLLWPPYLTLLERLVEASILEPGYLGASIARKATNLRRPGYFKGQSDESLPF